MTGAFPNSAVLLNDLFIIFILYNTFPDTASIIAVVKAMSMPNKNQAIRQWHSLPVIA